MPEPRPLDVDPQRDHEEVRRFWAHVVKGPGAGDCWLWTGAIADDGYGRFWLRRPGRRPLVVRPHRYVVALAHQIDLNTVEVSEHLVCDVPVCVRADATELDHVWPSTQAANLAGMARRGRGGGAAERHRGRGRDRASTAARSRALRQAVRGGHWDPTAIRAALTARHPDQGILPIVLD